jgi:hypothetical protein
MPSFDVSEYQYLPLQTSTSFRILELLPGRSSDSLQCRLHEFLLRSHPPFEALSYTWGDLDLNECVHLSKKLGVVSDGFRSWLSFFSIHPTWASNQTRVLRVTSSLKSALTRLRYRRKARMIWADAICIDQENIDERNAQVRLMGCIYGQAKRVIAYLGERALRSEVLFPNFQVILKNYSILNDHPDRLEALESVGLPIRNHEFWHAAGHFLRRPWFRRYWVIQEFVLGRQVQVVCGNWKLSWDTLWDVISTLIFLRGTEFFSERYLQIAPTGYRVCHITNLTELRIRRHAIKESVKLLDLLEICRTSSASDPRDCVFSLLGLATEKDEPDLAPDYGEPVEETYLRFARYSVKTGNGVQLLYNAFLETECMQIPSWVPNWSNAGFPTDRVAPDRTSGGISHFAASGDSRASINAIPGTKELVVKGIIVSALEIMGDLPPLKASNEYDTMELICNMVSEARSLVTPTNPYSGSQAIDEIVWRTLVCDQKGVTVAKDPLFYADLSADLVNCETYLNAVSASVFRNPNAIWLDDRMQSTFSRIYSYLIGTGPVVTFKRRAATSTGHLAQVPLLARKGDLVCVILGAVVPFVLRPQGNKYQLGMCGVTEEFLTII